MHRGSQPVTAPEGSRVTRAFLAVVQSKWSLEQYRDAESFASHVEQLMAKVDAERDPDIPCLVAFPEFIGLPLLFTCAVDALAGFRSWREAAGTLIQARVAEVMRICGERGVGPVCALMLVLSDTVRRIYGETFARAAAAHTCYLVAGSAPLPGPETGSSRIYNTSLVFGPDGAQIGAHRKVHPYGLEGAPEGLDIMPGPVAEVRAIATELGRVGIPICYDLWQPAVVDQLAAQGATILVQPSANPHPWDDWQVADWKTGLWKCLKEHPPFRYGLNPMMVGHLFAPGDEYDCDGRSSIVADSRHTPDGSGYLAQAALPPSGEPAQEQVVSSTVSFEHIGEGCRRRYKASLRRPTGPAPL